jgi:uncharacterized protein (TIGR03083 family)
VTLSVEQCLAAITKHSHGLADAARDNLAAPVEHCPGWTVADLVWHVLEVHWFWGTIAAELPSEPPDETRRPPRPPDDRLVEEFLAGADALVQTLRSADQSAACWTWATQKDVAFITRHQVQEAAVHHWDAVNASPRAQWSIEPRVAADAVEEFLTFSVSTEDDPVDRPALEGSIWICPCHDDDVPSWLITDGAFPGTVAWSAHDEGVDPVGSEAGVHTDAASALLWLYGRIPDRTFFKADDEATYDQELVDRFRNLCFTD